MPAGAHVGRAGVAIVAVARRSCSAGSRRWWSARSCRRRCTRRWCRGWSHCTRSSSCRACSRPPLGGRTRRRRMSRSCRCRRRCSRSPSCRTCTLARLAGVQMPPEQVSTVQALPSLAQSVAVVQRSQPSMVVSSQLPEAPHASLVQGFESSQSAAVLQGVQPSTVLWPQTPPSQVSSCTCCRRRSPLRSCSAGSPRTTKLPQTLESQTSVVQASPSSHSVAVLQCAQPVSTVQVLPWPQMSGVPAWQPVAGSQVSTPLQALPSSQVGGCRRGSRSRGRRSRRRCRRCRRRRRAGCRRGSRSGSQVSSPLQALPSSQASGVPAWQPVAGSQVSSRCRRCRRRRRAGCRRGSRRGVAGLGTGAGVAVVAGERGAGVAAVRVAVSPLQALPSSQASGVPVWQPVVGRRSRCRCRRCRRRR